MLTFKQTHHPRWRYAGCERDSVADLTTVRAHAPITRFKQQVVWVRYDIHSPSGGSEALRSGRAMIRAIGDDKSPWFVEKLRNDGFYGDGRCRHSTRGLRFKSAFMVQWHMDYNPRTLAFMTHLRRPSCATLQVV